MKKKRIISVFSVTLLLVSCSHHDAELEKDLNTRIDNFGGAAIEFCDCVDANIKDCQAEYDKANDAYGEMHKLYDLESENKYESSA